MLRQALRLGGLAARSSACSQHLSQSLGDAGLLNRRGLLNQRGLLGGPTPLAPLSTLGPRCFGSRGFATSIPTDYYELLGIQRGASDDDVKKAYRREALKWHPDRHPDATRPEAEKRFKLISEAYQTLSTASGRSTYDMRSSSSSSSSSRGAGAPEWGSARQGFGGFQQPPGGGPQRDWGYARGGVSREDADRIFREMFGNMGAFGRMAGRAGGPGGFGNFSPKDFELFEGLINSALRGARGAGREEVLQEVVMRPDGLRALRTTRTTVAPNGARVTTVSETVIGQAEAQGGYSAQQQQQQAYSQQRGGAATPGGQPQGRSLIKDLIGGFVASAASVVVPMARFAPPALRAHALAGHRLA